MRFYCYESKENKLWDFTIRKQQQMNCYHGTSRNWYFSLKVEATGCMYLNRTSEAVPASHIAIITEEKYLKNVILVSFILSSALLLLLKMIICMKCIGKISFINQLKIHLHYFVYTLIVFFMSGKMDFGGAHVARSIRSMFHKINCRKSSSSFFCRK